MNLMFVAQHGDVILVWLFLVLLALGHFLGQPDGTSE